MSLLHGLISSPRNSSVAAGVVNSTKDLPFQWHPSSVELIIQDTSETNRLAVEGT